MRIVEHAASKHMTVVPEFGLPGHTHALSLSHPELSADPVLSAHMSEVHEMFPGQGNLPARGVPYIGAAVGFSSLRADAPGLETFLREVRGEIATLTPGPYLHIGGDEALGTSREDYRAIVALAARLVAETGKTPVAWHEADDAPLPPGSVGQYWEFAADTEGADEKARACALRAPLDPSALAPLGRRPVGTYRSSTGAAQPRSGDGWGERSESRAGAQRSGQMSCQSGLLS